MIPAGRKGGNFNDLVYVPGWRRQWHPTTGTPVLLPGKSHGWRSLVGSCPWGHEELDTTERLHFHFSVSRNGEGNGNPLQCSCLENPRDRGAWWAAVYGIAQSQTRLKRLSSSSSSNLLFPLPMPKQPSSLGASAFCHFPTCHEPRVQHFIFRCHVEIGWRSHF